MITFQFYFQRKADFTEEEDNASENVVIVEEEPDGIENLEDLPRLVFVDEECGNIKQLLMAERLLGILTKKEAR